MEVLNFLQFIDGYVASFNHVLINNLLCLALAAAAFINRKDTNILFIVLVILIPSLLDILFVNKILLSGSLTGSSFFLFYSAYDALVLWLILYRETVIRAFLTVKVYVFNYLDRDNTTAAFTYARHVNEYKIIVLFALSILINLVVAAEYPIRAHVNKDILYFYYLYAPLKFALNIALVCFVFTLGSTKAKNIKE